MYFIPAKRMALEGFLLSWRKVRFERSPPSFSGRLSASAQESVLQKERSAEARIEFANVPGRAGKAGGCCKAITRRPSGKKRRGELNPDASLWRRAPLEQFFPG
jgi:hypothetical protein